ncbi:hypothetical protein AB0F81_16485 [Actinoplanes sp. NPDC024001]|uniref:hypothetical protein n=1 Tax=Actinoplanes sp. NPDC024001 TaxID=3154598 RepID=UPI0033F1C9A7
MDEQRLRAVLTSVLDRVPPVRYRLVGTAAALAQGVPMPAADVDILVATRADADSVAATLDAGSPAWLPESRQYFLRVVVDGTPVEVSTVEWPADGDTAECAGPGPWQHFVPVAVGRHVVPTVRLELRLVTELVRDRPDRYRALLAHMRAHGADRHLLERAMSGRGVDAPLREHVREQLPAGGDLR